MCQQLTFTVAPPRGSQLFLVGFEINCWKQSYWIDWNEEKLEDPLTFRLAPSSEIFQQC